MEVQSIRAQPGTCVLPIYTNKYLFCLKKVGAACKFSLLTSDWSQHLVEATAWLCCSPSGAGGPINASGISGLQQEGSVYFHVSWCKTCGESLEIFSQCYCCLASRWHRLQCLELQGNQGRTHSTNLIHSSMKPMITSSVFTHLLKGFQPFQIPSRDQPCSAF